MKMTKEHYQQIVSAFQENATVIQEHYNAVKESGRYKVLETRVGWDCIRAFLPKDFISKQYALGLNDTHISTAVTKALKAVLS